MISGDVSEKIQALHDISAKTYTMNALNDIEGAFQDGDVLSNSQAEKEGCKLKTLALEQECEDSLSILATYQLESEKLAPVNDSDIKRSEELVKKRETLLQELRGMNENLATVNDSIAEFRDAEERENLLAQILEKRSPAN